MFHKSCIEVTRSGFVLLFLFLAKVRTPNCSDNTCSFYLGKSHRPWNHKKNVEAKCRGTEGIKDQGRIDLRNARGHRDLGKREEKHET